MQSYVGFIENGGTAGAILRTMDWTENPLGNPAGWPVPLKTIVALMLAANQPMFVAWGAEQTLIYNDGYAQILAKRHPEAMGRPFFDVWPEVRSDVLPIMLRAFEGLPTSMDDIELVTHRNGFPEEAHFSFFYAPVRLSDAMVGGVFCACSDITEKVLTQRKVAEENARQRRLFDLAPGCIAILGGPEKAFAVEYVNQSYGKLFGSRELTGLPFHAVLPATHSQTILEQLDKLYRTGKAFLVHEVRFDHSDANGNLKTRYIDFLCDCLKDEEGRPYGIFVQGSDTTIAFTAKEALRQSNERFKAAVDAVGVMWTNSHDGRMMGEQVGWARLTGQKQAQYADLGWAEAIHPDDAHATLVAWREAVEQKKTFVFEHRVKTFHGSWRTHAVRAVPVLALDGQVREWVGVHIDIADQRDTQRALTDLNRTLEERVAERKAERDIMWQLSADLLLVLTQDGIVRSASPACQKILGLAPSQMANRPIGDWLHPDDIGEMKRVLLGVVVKPAKTTNRWRAADGEYRTIAWQASFETEAIFAAGHDITDELQAAKELEAAQKALRQAQRMESVGHLTGGIAHDFNNLLQGIGMSLQLIKRTTARPDQVERWVEKAMASVERGAKLTSQLLTFARLQQLMPEAVSVSSVLDGMAEVLTTTLGPLVDVNFDTCTTKELAVTADSAQLKVAVMNLCINARDAMPDGGRFTVATRQTVFKTERLGLQAGDYVEISLTDTGCGMSQEVQERAFDPFFSTKELGKGTGLGLSQVYGFAHQLGGLASIESELGVGTTVRILLRQTAGVNATPNNVSSKAVPTADAEIVLVDDDVDVLSTLKEMLLDRGYKVRACNSAAQCMIELDRKPADLLITDYAMPVTNGAQLAKRALEIYPRLPVVIATGYANPAELREAVGAEATVVRKPFDIDSLVSVIESKLFKKTR